MNEVILWSLWYGVLISLPLIMTRLLLKNAMGRVMARRQSS
jgi:hypothetical protein